MGRLTHSSASEKLEIIRLVEESWLSVKQTLAELDIPRSTFYRWYERYLEAGDDGLIDRQPSSASSGTHSEGVREQVVQIALEQPERRLVSSPGTSRTPRAISSPSPVFTAS